MLLLILIFQPLAQRRCLFPLVTGWDWLYLHAIFTRFELLVLPAMLALFWYVAVLTSVRIIDVALLALWFEAVWLGFIYFGREFRNTLGMEYMGFDFASMKGATAFSALSYACFEGNKRVQGMGYLLSSLKMLAGYLPKVGLECEGIDKSIIALELLRRAESVDYSDSCRKMAKELSEEPGEAALMDLPKVLREFTSQERLSWANSFVRVKRRLPWSTTQFWSILMTALLVLASYLSEDVKSKLLNWFVPLGSPETILSLIYVAFAIFGYPQIGSYLNRAPITYSDLKRCPASEEGMDRHD